MARIVNEGIEDGSLVSVYRWGALMLSVTALGALFAVARNILASRVSQLFGADMRSDLFEKILHFSEQSADNIKSGSLIMRMTNDVTQETQFINGLMRVFIKAPLTCAGGIVLASLMNLQLSLIVYSVVAVVAILLYITMKLSYPRFRKLQQAMDKLNTGVEEYLIGVRLVKAFGTGTDETRKFDADNRDLMHKSIWAMLLITCVSPVLTLIVGFGSAAIIYAGSLLFTKGLTQPGDISAFIVYMAQILSSLLMITNLFNIFARTKASSDRIREVMESDDDFSRSSLLSGCRGRWNSRM
jgi:ATP-binding cassette subfamily B protein